ncbi:Gfo/Idh/MocA family protein [Endozoicomonas sp. SCSIO W0465]|uniref:Gfo/Idh/MocA family protein n=1 Tax=Endozoicomonas sp. SCSIO W0465 TaxID=2918516 RepID=UPI00207579F3|nr:Gfo/Idh/MocA family oxidoreductase [Endozoicomonas sp. SCSIO W0465]USE35819.1 Gfo/Idh/MocA family oxidoreductase [Endozoicomonas sp. SCSIO W0465]
MLRTAVIGAGYLGKFHAEKYARLATSDLVGVADIDEACGQEVASNCNTHYFSDYRDLLGQVDAVSVVVPTALHHAIASDCLKAGVHVLVEKPIASNLSQAEEMIKLARERQLILQVGFLERYNAALGSAYDKVKQPRFIESHRLASFKPRSMDINVIMDLMIHDLDIILNMVDSPIMDIAANGSAVLSETIDIAQARLSFADGCVANLTASRISQKSKRKMRIFQKCSCICVDFQALKLSHFFKGEGELHPGIPTIECHEQSYQGSDALRLEIEDFLLSVKASSPPKVSGEDGKDALNAANRISEIIVRTGMCL